MSFLGVSFVGLVVGLLALGAVFYGIERVWPAIPRRPRAPNALTTDILWWFVTPFMSRIAMAITLVVAAAIVAVAFGRPEGEGIRRFFERENAVSRLPLWAQSAIVVLWLDLAGYWGHRWFHRVKRLWRFHAVHHSSEWVDWLSSVRVHPVNELGMRLLQATPLLVCGFDFSAVAAAAPALTLYAIFIHANVPWGFGPLRYVIATPVFHRWHHTSQDEGLDKNFSGGLVWPDLVFKTLYLPKGRQPERFGLSGEHVPEDILRQMGYGFTGR